MDAHFSAMRQSFEQWATLSDEQWQMLSAIFQIKRAEAKALITLPGDLDHELIFGVHQGFVVSAENMHSKVAIV